MEEKKTNRKYPRSSGVLLSITMLHGPFGIGVLGKEALEFIDFLSGAGFHIWQVLPIEHTGESFSPYKCISAYAGEPMLIDPRMLLDMKLITKDELNDRVVGLSDDYVDYEQVREKQWKLLRKAFSRISEKKENITQNGNTSHTGDTAIAPGDASNKPRYTIPTKWISSKSTSQIPASYKQFKPSWIDSYILYMALRHRFDDKPWYEWPDEKLRAHDADAIRMVKTECRDEFDFHRFVQWLFYIQWTRIKEYAAKHDVAIVGDMPFYVSEDSVEVWSARNLFNADSDGGFLAVAGAPPDYFSPLGQHWGNPIYNWRLMKKNSYRWWVRRVKAAIERYDHVRIDHFRGFESYWSIPADAPDATTGVWVNGPGIALFRTLESALANTNLPLIAEDLGDTHGNVDKLLSDTGLRGMRVLQFGFLGDDKHLPHSFTEDCIAYTGTHDNTTMLAWLFELTPEDRESALFYLGFDGDWTQGGPNSSVNKAWIRLLFTSSASVAIVPIQDLLGYGADTRTNTPGTPEGNWRFRIRSGALDDIDSVFYKALVKASDRDNTL